MTSGDDSEEDGPEFSGIIQPPLIHQLKSILDQYPDDGQILKEIIQNAEDAEASEMKVLFDERYVNKDDGTKQKAFKKYFKGPALCVYNNASFTDADWRGIQMIYQSVKEFDPVKVGRFGLGFKSVFHITDYPLIISGGKMLVIDPHQKDPGKVCVTMKLNRLHKYKRQMESSYCLNALDGIFGFSQDILDTGNFHGTLFRFPLRHDVSPLSDNIYGPEKISDLFTAFQSEASVELLFLKCLEKIALFWKTEDNRCSDGPFFTVKIAHDCIEDVRLKRSELQSFMRMMLLSVTEETYIRTFDLTVVTQNATEEPTKQDWFVMHCRKGKPLSDEFIKLSQDESLSYSPYVSVAVPLFVDPPIIGHVFCLMPLPLENESLTGYPVHVNGLFALDQNRRHVKWPSADQTKNQTHTDKPTRWNKCLVSEVLADVYHMTIKELLRKCENNNFDQRDVKRVYNIVPDLRKITSNWNHITDPLVERLLKTPFLFTSKDGGRWILPNQAVFSILDGNNTKEIENSVLMLAKECGVNLVDVPEHLLYMLQEYRISFKTLSKKYIRNCLNSEAPYKSFSFDDKMNILLYLANDGDYSILAGLELIPLHSGSFISFGAGNTVYVCRVEADLFPGQEASFVRQGLQENVFNVFSAIAKQGVFQELCTFEDQPANVIASLVEGTLQLQNDTLSSTTVSWDRTGPNGETWLRKVWLFIHRFSLSSFSNVHLIPDFRNSVLCKVSQKFLMRSFEGYSISENISSCLRHLGITVLEEVNDEIEQHKEIRNYILTPTSDNVFGLMAQVHSRITSSQTQAFNSSVTQSERDEFVLYLSKYRILSSPVKELIYCMNLYLETKSGRPVSVRDIKRVVKPCTIPVQYFRESLNCPTSDHESLATLLNAQVLQEEDVIIDILNNLRNQYDTDDINRMMNHVLTNLPDFKQKDKILSIAKGIHFLTNDEGQMKKADELYDPKDDLLQTVIIDKNKFPNTEKLPVKISLLRIIGLRSLNDVTAEDVLTCAQIIQDSVCDSISIARSKAITELISRIPQLLQCKLFNSTLAELLKSIRFVLPRTRSDSYPMCLPWYGNELSFCCPSNMYEVKHAVLIGSIKPVLPYSMTGLSENFLCNKEASVADVIDQLLVITSKYKDKYKPDLLPMISSLYRFLSRNPQGDYQKLKHHKWLWTGNGFDEPGRIYLQTNTSDISLVPYMFPLPSEFCDKSLQSFFRQMGCIKEQTPSLLIKVQVMIRDKYKKGKTCLLEAKSDHQLVLSIINHIKDSKDSTEIKGVLVPVKQDDDSKVVLYPVNECNYCRDDEELYGDEKHFVHQDITPDTAEKLGVPTVMDTLLEDAERLEEWGQNEPLTRRIKNLLESYKDGLSVPKEIIQNADDAGATKVYFMYDERDKYTYGRKLIDKNMLECQGPALWAYNDAVFTDEDLKNITKVSGATKQKDLSKIGRFGLGFCSVYNLTDVPSFVSGNSMVMFDPHYEYLGDVIKAGKQPGIKVDFVKNRKILERKTSQFEPFNDVFGCNLRTDQKTIYFNGTLFRFPLRTKRQALSSEISDVTYDRRQINSLLKIFAEAGGNLLLFTQNVHCVEFYHLRTGTPDSASLVYSVTRETTQDIPRPLSHYTNSNECSVIKELRSNLEKVKSCETKQLCQIGLILFLNISIVTDDCLADFDIDGTSSSTTWMVAWSSGTDKSKNLALQSNHRNVFPLASVACPLETSKDGSYKTRNLESLPFGYYRTSHIYCFLPIPVKNNLPVIINGSFAVTSDRRNLSCKTTDDKDTFESEWNEALMSDAVCNAFVLFLQRFNKMNVDPSEPYYKTWPVNCNGDETVYKFQRSFYENIITIHSGIEIFRRNDKIGSFEKCKFLDTSILDTQFGEKAFSVCVQHLDDEETIMMKLPKHVQRCFNVLDYEDPLKQKTLGVTEFYKRLVFPYLKTDVWNIKMVDLLMVHALENMSGDLKVLLKESECIPTSPNNLLRRPDELVTRHCKISGLFHEEDECFISTAHTAFSKDNIISTLWDLGMNRKDLPKKLLLDRAKSISLLANVCSQCALGRYHILMEYLENNIEPLEQRFPELFPQLKSIQFLPVKKKPDDWPWLWGGEKVESVLYPNYTKYTCKDKSHEHDRNLIFENAANLYVSSITDLVCAKFPVLDDNGKYKKLHAKLELSTAVSTAFAFEHLSYLCKIVNSSDEQIKSNILLSNTLFAIYKFLNDEFDKDDNHYDIVNIANQYRDEPIILVQSELVKPSMIVVDCDDDCSPYFFRLNAEPRIKDMKTFLNNLQVEEKCTVTRVLKVLHGFKRTQLNESEISIYVRLLRTLVNSLAHEKSFEAVKDVLVPDYDGALCPVSAVCFDEPKVKSTASMKFVHKTISRDIALSLGISTKREQKIKECSSDLDEFSQEFGQHEELTTRIRRILSGYPCDGGVLKELVQNADDAGASEVHIVMDLNHHPTENLFSDTWKLLQGPAILVYNDRSFSKSDIKGIQNLGVGSKFDDPTKTGQYGVGFNAVYHFTDVPSFLTKGEEVETGEVLCTFDPHCRFVPRATPASPGKLYFNTDVLKEDHPNVFECYHSNLLMNDKGTIFRLPLRTNTFLQHSKLSNKELTPDIAKEFVFSLQKEMMDILLFVNSIRSIRISEIKSGELKEIYSVDLSLHITDIDMKKYKNAIRKCSKLLKNKNELTRFEAYETSYKVQVKDSNGLCLHYLIVRRVGFSGSIKCPELICTAHRQGDLGLLPRGGIALPLNENAVAKCFNHGKLFCFLPLPLETGLPVHCNGHFALDHEARRNLWTDDKDGLKKNWNNLLFKDVIAPAYTSALQVLRNELCFDTVDKGILRVTLSKYHKYFPDIASTSNDYIRELGCSVYQRINIQEVQLFPCLIRGRNSKTIIQFYSLKGTEMAFPCVFYNLKKTEKDVGTFEVVDKFDESVEELPNSNEKKIQPKANKNLQLVHIVIDLGVKLLDSSHHIFQGLKEAGIDVCEMSPDFLTQFIKSYDSNECDKCLIKVKVPVEQTVLKYSFRVLECLKYCKQSSNFSIEIEGLPLCLTEDGILREFSTEHPVFRSTHARMFEESHQMFLHKSLYGCLSDDLPGLKRLCIKDFAILLRSTLQSEKYRTHNIPVKWNAQSKNIPSVDWLKDVWDFLKSSVSDELKARQPADECKQTTERAVYIEILQPLMPWCLVPTNLRDSTSKVNEAFLFPMNSVQYVLDTHSYKRDIRKALECISLPKLDELVFSWNNDLFSFLVTHEKSPFSLLCFLHHYRKEFGGMKSLESEQLHFFDILEYFAADFDNLLRESDGTSIENMLKEIPLHVTVDGQISTLTKASNVMIFDSSISQKIVIKGLKVWAKKSDTLMIKSTHKTRHLYVKLGFTSDKISPIDLYIKHFLPTFHFFPKGSKLKHLEYMRDELLVKSIGKMNNKEKQRKLILLLKDVKFLPSNNGILYKASHFKSPFNKLMTWMCNVDDFPAPPFGQYVWKEFLNLAGIQSEITPEMILMFARQIEKDGKHEANEDIKNKSKQLVGHILSRPKFEEEDFLEELSKIKFLVPYNVDEWKKDIYPPPNTGLACFRDSVFESHADIAWTTCTIISKEADPTRNYDMRINTNRSEIIRARLGIFKKPPLDKIIQHIQNITDALKDIRLKSLSNPLPLFKVKTLMKKIYEWLNITQKKHSIEIKKNLAQKSIVFLLEPGLKMFLPCNRFVRHLDKSESKIEPYLMCLPDEYLEFYDVFHLLGMVGNTSICTYIRVLSDLRNDVEMQSSNTQGKKLHIREQKFVQLSLTQILSQLAQLESKEKNALENVEELYLLSREETLVRSNCLVYSDNIDFEEKIGADIGMMYMMDFDKLEIEVSGSVSDKLKKLPTKIRPKILSDMILKNLDNKALVSTRDDKGDAMKDFFASTEFLEAVIRICAHSYMKTSIRSEFSDNIVREIMSGIQNLKICQVKSIILDLSFDNKQVGKKEKTCYYQTSPSPTESGKHEHTLFCAFKDASIEEWIIDNYGTIVESLKNCTSGRFLDVDNLFMQVIYRIMNRDQIMKALDAAEVKEYKINRRKAESLFPPPGTAVHRSRHCFLSNNFCEFEDGEYVALLISEETYTPGRYIHAEYIYAIVVKKIHAGHSSFVSKNLATYEVKVGRDRIENRQAYDLYKFNRLIGEKEQTTDMAVFSNMSELESDNRNLDEILKEIKATIKEAWTFPEYERKKIIKRLYKKWHPDRNFGNEKIATEVFKYIKIFVCKMERDEDIDDKKTRFDSKTYDGSNFYEEAKQQSRFWSDFENWDRGFSEERRYHGQSASGGRPNRNFRRQTQYERVPSVAQARQWMKQAKSDFRAAEVLLPSADEGPHFNWICIMCYQSLEKGLKAWHYNIDCNKVPDTRNLNLLASGLDRQISLKVKRFTAEIGSFGETMYPSLFKIPKIPADIFTKQVAVKARDITKDILDYINDMLYI